MQYQAVVAQATSQPTRDSAYNVSYSMGGIVGVLLLVIIVLIVVQKVRGKKG